MLVSLLIELPTILTMLEKVSNITTVLLITMCLGEEKFYLYLTDNIYLHIN